jgi:hypothetical protein
MRLQWGIYLAILAAPAMRGSTIDVSGDTSAVVRTGESLVFQLLTWNYGMNAAAFGLPVYPADVNFALVSAGLPSKMSGAGEFAATLESADHAVSAAFGDLTFSPGYFEGSGYAGAVSTLQGYLHLSPQLSKALFSASSAVLVLRNEGPDVTVGLAPYMLRQSLYASLSGGPLSVGAVPILVDLESGDGRAHLGNSGGKGDPADDAKVPEPRSGGLLLGGGILLCGLSAVLSRVSRGRG